MIKEIAKIIRGLSVDAIEKANSGHPGLPLGCAEIGAVLFGEILDYDPSEPNWANRDRFILSAGHGSMLLYSLLFLSGYDVTLDDIQNFRKIGSKTPGHPELGITPGVEATTGPLGQGFANSVGIALAEKILSKKFNTNEYPLLNHYTYVLASDGCMMEGITSEAASLAGHWGLEKLVVIYDQNHVSLAGNTELIFTESVADRYRAYGWHVFENVNGHDPEELRSVFKRIKEKSNEKPVLVIARTHIGYGAPTKQDSYVAHGAPLGKEEVLGLKENIGLPLDQPFYISNEVKDFFQKKRVESIEKRKNWDNKFKEWSEKYPEKRKTWNEAMDLTIPPQLDLMEIDFKEDIATRSASGKVLNKIAEKIGYIIGGSADLSPSTMTYLDQFPEIQKGCFDARNIRFGVREHAMGGICNGIELHGGLRAYCSTFLVFSDYMRPAIRLAAMMHLPVIYIFTHDSIYVGEDGPTHQPFEQLESLRLIPNLEVFRPADAEEVIAAWKMILKIKDRPVAMILSRQKLPDLVKINGVHDFYKGGYIIREAFKEPDVIISASGSEVQIAVKVSDILEKDGISCRVVSVPDRELFANQDKLYKEKVLGSTKKIQVVIEASTGQGWYKLISGLSFGFFIQQFGKSGPGDEVAKQFGFDPEKIASIITRKIHIYDYKK